MLTTKRKVLVVEDNALNRMILCQILAGEYKALEAENGRDALGILARYGEEISLILLDIKMPVMDGYTFLTIMKNNPDFSSIPVIVTTQSDSETDEVTALSKGAADFVSKPYKPQIILHRVASIINLRESAAMVNLLQYDPLTGIYSKAYFYERVDIIRFIGILPKRLLHLFQCGKLQGGQRCFWRLGRRPSAVRNRRFVFRFHEGPGALRPPECGSVRLPGRASVGLHADHVHGCSGTDQYFVRSQEHRDEMGYLPGQ